MTISRNDLIIILKKLGNRSLTNEQIKLLRSLLRCTTVKQKLVFEKVLTERESLCLLLAAKGLTSKEIAELLDITERTVKTHREGICRKLSCNNIAQAVFEGIRYGYLE